MSKNNILKLCVRGTDQVINVGKNAQLGRAEDLEWATNRPIPKEFKNLELAVTVHAGNNPVCISRNHCAILYNSKKEIFTIMDLRSKNGTYLNSKKLTPCIKYGLEQGDVIELSAGNGVLDIENTIDESLNNYALLVAHDELGLAGGRNSLRAIGSQLNRRGFKNNVLKLYGPKATKKKVMNYLEKLNPLTTPNSHFLFYYSGSGDRGIKLVNGEEITQAELYSTFANMRGKKAVIFDCCDASDFLDSWHVLPHQTIVVGTRNSGKPKHYCDGSAASGALVFGNFMGELTSAFVEYLDHNPGRLNLRDLKDRLIIHLGNDTKYGSLVDRMDVEGEGSYTVGTCIYTM